MKSLTYNIFYKYAGKSVKPMLYSIVYNKTIKKNKMNKKDNSKDNFKIVKKVDFTKLLFEIYLLVLIFLWSYFT